MIADRAAKKKILILNLLILAGILIHSIYRDLQFEKQYPGDLRNRVVGARLQKDGISPYFYKWKSKDGEKYIDKQNDDSLKVSNITATPFFHELLYPICYFQQFTISKTWLWIEYIILMCIALIFVRLATTSLQALLVVNITVIFTCTEAWKSLISNGQIYLVVSLLLSVIILGILKTKSANHFFLTAAVAATMLVLIRPIALISLIALLPGYKQLFKFIATTGFMLMIYGLFVLVNQKEKIYWVDYYNALQEQVNLHQDHHPSMQKNEPIPPINTLEGFDMEDVANNYKEHTYPVHSENGNIFVLYNLLTHQKISVRALSAALFVVIASLVGLFFLLKNKNDLQTAQLLLLSFLLYMITDLFSPIYRHQYNTVQWLPLLLFAFTCVGQVDKATAIMLISGIALNITNIQWIPMRHTVGEYIWLAGLLIIVFRKIDLHKINS